MYKQEKNQEFINKFNTSNAVGKVGEALLPEFFAKTWPNMRLEDVSMNPDYQWQDIDYILHYKDGSTKTLELKTDTQGGYTGNFAIETVANKESSRKGWIYTSSSDLLAYLFVNGMKDGSNNLFIMNMADMRNVIHNNPNLRTAVAKPERQLRGEGMKTTIVTLVPHQLVKSFAHTYRIAPQNVKNSHSAQTGQR